MLFDYLVNSQRKPDSPLFPAAIGKTGKLSRRPLVRTDAADMLKRRLKKLDNRVSLTATNRDPPPQVAAPEALVRR